MAENRLKLFQNISWSKIICFSASDKHVLACTFELEINMCNDVSDGYVLAYTFELEIRNTCATNKRLGREPLLQPEILAAGCFVV